MGGRNYSVARTKKIKNKERILRGKEGREVERKKERTT